MGRTRQHGTGAELALRSALHRRGLRFRVQRPLGFDRRRRADIVFPKERLAVFVDGCFWHSCPQHATFPRANAAWWSEKLARNVERDHETNQRLAGDGWTVVRVWEHEHPEDAALKIHAVRDQLRHAARGERDPWPASRVKPS
jgi:DNA mismatch endonuclease (patch repair protein)